MGSFHAGELAVQARVGVQAADIACFPYIGLAADGKLSLDAYPNILAWIDRIKRLPGYVGMPGL